MIYWIWRKLTLLLIALMALSVAAEATQNENEVVKTRKLFDQINLALGYLNGTGVPLDYKKAFSLLEEPANCGIGKAEYNLAFLYENGKGVRRSPELAFQWYQRAANHGYPEAERSMGAVYFRGVLGQAENKETARKWYLLAAEHGDASAMAKLGRMMLEGSGGEADSMQAFLWAIRGAEAGNAEAEGLAAWLYAEGASTFSKDDELAWIWSYMALQSTPAQKDNEISNLQNTLSSRMSGDALAKATSLATDYMKFRADGGMTLLPNRLDIESVHYVQSNQDQPIEFSTTHVGVPIAINGQGPFHFMIDTGAYHSIIEEKLAKKLKLPVVGMKPDSFPIPNARDIVEADYKVCGNEIQQGLFLALPLDFFQKDQKEPIDGILGGDFLEQFLVEINYKSGTIALRDPKQVDRDNLGEAIPITFSSGKPVITTTLNIQDIPPIKLFLLVDIGGGPGIYLNNEFNQKFSFSKVASNIRPGHVDDLIGTTPVIHGTIQSALIGTQIISAPEVTCDDDGKATGQDISGSIGGEIWSKFKKLTIDYQNKCIYILAN